MALARSPAAAGSSEAVPTIVGARSLRGEVSQLPTSARVDRGSVPIATVAWLAGSGADMEHQVNATVTAEVGSSADVTAKSMAFNALNHVDKPALSDPNIKSTSGGFLTGGGIEDKQDFLRLHEVAQTDKLLHEWLINL